MAFRVAMLLFAAVIAVPDARADLAAVKGEANSERRADLALQNAGAAIDTARQSYESGEIPQFEKAVQEVQDSVQLAYEALTAEKPLSRNARHGKKAEQQTKQLLRRMDGLAQFVGADDRGRVEDARKAVSEVHDKLLEGIMERRK